MKFSWRFFLLCMMLILVQACLPGGNVVRVTTVSEDKIEGLGDDELAKLAEIRKVRQNRDEALDIKEVIESTPNYSVEAYLKAYGSQDRDKTLDYRVGGFDVLDIVVYEEPDLSRKDVRVSADGYISFPLIGRVFVDGFATSEIERIIAEKLAEGQYLLDAHVAVMVVDYQSRKYMVLGSVSSPGTYPLRANERMLDAISKAGGIQLAKTSYEAVIIRSAGDGNGKKIAVHINLDSLMKKGDPLQNLALVDGDLIYIPVPENFYIIGQVHSPGAITYQGDITLVEAIGMAGGFTPIAARNRTRIIRVENGEEKIIYVKVDAITGEGKKTQDVQILPGDVIVVPESYW
ncbi:MAG: polysaccharide export protein [Lentisphaeria bacterium]|nr:polysaccharide export protein [Lentisphaeria bacterium]